MIPKGHVLYFVIISIKNTCYINCPIIITVIKSPVKVLTKRKELDVLEFKPLGYESSLNLQYTQVYKEPCIYHTADTIWQFTEVCFPNFCLTKDKAYAQLSLKNNSKSRKTYYIRLFYQNTTYWYPTDDSISLNKEEYLDNYYGASKVIGLDIDGEAETVVKVPFTIGMNTKHEFDFDPLKDPARSGNYEFIIMALPVKDRILMQDDLNLKKINPFALIKRDQLLNKGQKYYNYCSYVGSHHFKFVSLDEYFDGTNDLAAGHVYLPKKGGEKKLCDTCTGWYKAIISENWESADFFSGAISKWYRVKSDYGIQAKNVVIDTTGVKLCSPKSRRGEYHKTWGEFLFGPSYKYGHFTVRAKFISIMNHTGTPNGIIHNLWLYQRDPDEVDTTNPYSYLRNSSGRQPYEIDFEFWHTQQGYNNLWDRYAFINYSVVDYMRDTTVAIKPGEEKKFGKYKANRFNNRQCHVPGENFTPDFFESFHNYELYWYPTYVRFLVDGKECALITKEMAKIPDKYLFLWIGSPMYQDGTFYNQSSVPFLEKDKESTIDYIRVE